MVEELLLNSGETPNAPANRAPRKRRGNPTAQLLGAPFQRVGPLLATELPFLHAGAVDSYRMSSSAAVSIDSGTLMPNALAVLRFTTSLNLVGCPIGKIPRL